MYRDEEDQQAQQPERGASASVYAANQDRARRARSDRVAAPYPSSRPSKGGRHWEVKVDRHGQVYTCEICKIPKVDSEQNFSSLQIKRFHQNAALRARGAPSSEIKTFSCDNCTAKQQKNIYCTKCDKTMPTEFFALTQRPADRAVCKQCQSKTNAHNAKKRSRVPYVLFCAFDDDDASNDSEEPSDEDLVLAKKKVKTLKPLTLADLKKAYEQDSDDASDLSSEADDDFYEDGFAKPKKSAVGQTGAQKTDPLDRFDDEGNLKETASSATASEMESAAAAQMGVQEDLTFGLADYEEDV